MNNQIFFYEAGGANRLITDLVAYYKFENDVIDSTGIMPLATATGTDFISGKVGNAIRFNATTDRVDIPDTSNLSFTNGSGTDIPFSISMWVFFTGFSVIGNWLINKRNDAGGDEWQFFISQPNRVLKFYKFDRTTNSSFQGVATPISLFSLNTWYHIVFTDDGSKTNSGMKIYVNGVSQTLTNDNSGTYTGMLNGTAITRMGLNAWNLITPNAAHQGYLDESSIWKNRVINQSEVTYLYNNGFGRTYPI